MPRLHKVNWVWRHTPVSPGFRRIGAAVGGHPGPHPTAHNTAPPQTDAAVLATDDCDVGLGASGVPSLGLIPELVFQSFMTEEKEMQHRREDHSPFGCLSRRPDPGTG